MKITPIKDKKIIRKEISADEFIKIWKGDYINDIEKTHYYIEQPNRNNAKRVEIKDTEIIGRIEIEDEDDLCSLHLINSKTDIFVIKHCKIRNIQIVGDIEIEDSSVIEQLVFKECSSINYLTIEKSKVISGIGIWDNCECDKINIKNSFIKSILVEVETAIVDSINIDCSTVQTLCVEKGATVKSIFFKQSRTLLFRICGNAKFDYIKIWDNSICKDLKIDSVYISESIYIRDSQFNNFYLKAYNLPETDIHNSFIENLKYNNIIASTFNLKNCEVVNFIMFEMRTGKDGLIQLIDCYINHLIFDTMLNLASFNISNLNPLRSSESVPVYNNKTEKYSLDSFNKNEAKISFINSDLGKMMISSDLSTFDELIFSNSKIVDVFIAGTKLPVINTLNTGDSDRLMTQQKIAYSQIKKIYQNRGDSVTPMHYRMLEMEAYRNDEIDEDKKKKNYERLQLWFNYHTNRHGTDWCLALCRLLLSSAIFYVIYCICLFGVSIPGDWVLSFKLVPYYFEFINPIHKSDFLVNLSFDSLSIWQACALIIEFIGRILTSLLTYQTISAFRKYGSK